MNDSDTHTDQGESTDEFEIQQFIETGQLDLATNQQNHYLHEYVQLNPFKF